jgi:hypothetical protein
VQALQEKQHAATLAAIMSASAVVRQEMLEAADAKEKLGEVTRRGAT